MRRVSCGEAFSASHPARAVLPRRYGVRGRSPEKPPVSWVVAEEALRNGRGIVEPGFCFSLFCYFA